MKIVVYILTALLIVALAGGAFFYLVPYKQMAGEYEKLKQGQPEFDKARRELNKFKEKEKQESQWTGAAAEALKKGLAREIEGGKAEVIVSGSRIVVNIAESVVFTPNSVTFAKDSQPFLANLAALLKDIKDKEISVGNTTVPAPAQGKGRKKVPAKDARTLASGRTLELVKNLAKNGVSEDALISAAYPAKLPDRGYKLKDQKVIIVISSPVPADTAAAPAKTDPKPAAASKPTTTPTATTAPQLKTIPITTAKKTP